MSRGAQFIDVRVREIVAVTPWVKRFRFEAADGSALPPFSAGAHVIVEMRDGETTRHNAYSLMSAPRDPSHYAISVRRDDAGRGGSRFLHEALREGAALRISHPVNLFPLDLRAKRHLLIAGGIGITPFLAMVEQMAGGATPFELHYATRSRAHAAYADDLAARFGDRVHVYHEEDGETVPLDRILGLQGLGTHLYVCGPSGMIDWVMGTAAARGWPRETCHCERFLAPPSGEPYTVHLERSGRTVAVGGQESMLEAIEAAGIDAPYLCRGGVCGQCETRVLSYDGALLHADHFLSDDEKASGTKVMPCVSRFVGQSLVLDL